MDVRIVSHTLTSACGRGNQSLMAALAAEQTPLTPNDYRDSYLDTWIGRVMGLEEYQLDTALQALNSRNNRLSDLALNQDGFASQAAAAITRFGAHKVGVVIGTSTSSVGRTESGYSQLNDQEQMPAAYQQPDIHNPHAPGHFVAQRLGVTGPNMTISTACSSSSKVFVSAARWLQCGLVDAVVVGGVDSLCLSILHGFASLELVSTRPCRPFDRDRDGINIGEAAGFALLMRAEDCSSEHRSDLRLSGYGESSDAFHMAQPHPEGKGAASAMEAALHTSGLAAEQIGYINLHGTASRANDLAETKAVASLFPQSTKVSSTKGWTGHTLGAAGITGAVIAMEALRKGWLPGTLHLDNPDQELAFPVMKNSVDLQVEHVMANSLGFGGNNCALIFSRVTQ